MVRIRHPARSAVAAIVAAWLILIVPATAQAATTVRQRNDLWRPHTVTVPAGSRVRWHVSTGQHTVTAYGGNWSKDVTLDAGESTSARFRRAGTYRYRCTLHSSLSGGVCNGMCGRVVVT